MADINPYAGGSIPSNIYTKKEEGYATKGNAKKTRKKDDRNIFQKAGDKIKAKANNAAATVFGDRAIDYSQHSDEKLQEMIKKNPGSADAADAQRELNKRNEAAGMATKAINIKNAQGGTDDMRFSSGNTIEDAQTFGDTKAKDVPAKLEAMGKDPATTSREEAAALLKTDNPATPSTPTAGGVGTVPSAPAPAPTEPEGISTGISTDEPTEDLSAPWKSTDEAVESIKNDINTKAAATPEMKSIWQAWKNGDIDKATRNYFIADAIAKFAGDMGNISHAQHANNMWANIESGNQLNPMENVKGDNQWQDYLKTDWKEAQKLKNEARSKEQLGNIDNQLEVSKQRGFDQYLANEKPEILKDSKWAKMAKEDPDSYATLQQLGQMIDGKSPLTADQLGNLIDAAGNAKLGNDIGQKQLEMLGLSKQQAEESLQALKFANELNNATKQYQIATQKYGVDSIQAQNAAMWAQTAGQNLANTFSSRTLDSRVKKGIYGGLGINAGPVNIDSGSAASILGGLGIPLPAGN